MMHFTKFMINILFYLQLYHVQGHTGVIMKMNSHTN